jgi:hypothetical protein
MKNLNSTPLAYQFKREKFSPNATESSFIEIQFYLKAVILLD